MDINYDEAVSQAKKLLNNFSISPSFHKYSKGYLFTTEYINRYLSEITIKSNRALSVLTSGDHIFNLVAYGITNIDAFDVNVLNYFTFWLKYAFIMNLDYHQFKKLPKIISKDSTLILFLHFLEKSRNDMPEEVYQYYCDTIQYHFSLDWYNGLRNLFFPTYSMPTSSNLYMQSEEEYIHLREALKRLTIRFYFEDVRNMPKLLTDTYDAILLSNIADYLDSVTNYEQFKKYIASFFPFLEDTGVIIHYLYGLNHQNVIEGSSITLDDLGRENVRRLTRLTGEGYYIKRGNS